jgi:hypothetical protein
MFKKNIKFIVFFSIAAIFLVVGNLALAQSDYGLDVGGALNLGDTDPKILAVRIIQIILGFLGILALGFIIYGGFVWMTSNGDEKRVEIAKKIIISAVIGIVIILSSLAIATYVINKMSSITDAEGGGGGDGGGSTVPYGDEGGTSCDSNTLTAVCEADDGLCSAGYYCNPSNCRCRPLGGIGDSCDSEDGLGGCQPGGTLCGSGLFCDSDSCTCQEGSGLGQSCDSDKGIEGCQADSGICSRGLTCDNFGESPTCTCIAYPIIEEISPVGGFCTNNINTFCTKDSDCSDSNCNISAPNGAVGNIITISGQHFGTTTGSVLFWDGSSFGTAALPPSNPLCDNNWTDERIIITIPDGAESGPIRIITADSKIEDTDNEVGSVLPDFVLNTIERPGLCKISPESGSFDEEIFYYGVNMENSSAKFGSLKSSISGKNSSFGSLNGSALVPNIKVGNTTTFVSSFAGVPSNYFKFKKIGEKTAGPRIISFEPAIGAPGQYITIYGSGFGSSQGTGSVYFGDDETGVEANYSFPSICSDSVWSDKQILIKVPNSISDGNYNLTIFANGETVDTQDLSPSFFTVSAEEDLSPSLCKIKPSAAEIGQTVELWGEYFGDFDSNLSKVKFSNNRNVFGIGYLPLWAEEGSGGNRAYHIEAVVPEGAVTGLVRVVKNSPEVVGNGLNLEIGSCLESSDSDAVCGSQVCCPAETSAAGRCADSLEDCSVDIPSSVFEWEFSTSFELNEDDLINQSCADRSKLSNTCPFGVCLNSPGECSADNDNCECCCLKANGDNDCCLGLSCEGACGSDRNEDSGTYGLCSGCRIEKDGVVDQAASDAACNCEGSSYAKYCDVNADPDGDGVPEGVCGDCASLNTESCTIHSATCCVDGTKDNNCVSRQFARGEGNVFGLVEQDGLAYCGYHVCDEAGGCSASGPVAFPEDKGYKKFSECQAECGGGSFNLGLYCENRETGSCDDSICSNPFSCRAGYEKGCGYCCCDPSDDKCSIINSSLVCQPDVAPCGGEERGLCCGCSENSQCVSDGSEPVSVGCGVDSCCRTRPSIIAQSPADGSTDACTNAAIYVDFNQTMQPGSFKGNVLVVGEYSGDCPENTVLLSSAQDSRKNLFYALANNAADFIRGLFGKNVKASPGPDPSKKYCAIAGSVGSEQIGSDSTRLLFRPSGILDVGVKYFVIIKGDGELNNSAGVKNSFGIGMYADNSPVDNSSSFGGLTFTKTIGGETYHPAYIWSFTTRNNGEKGLCDISSVEIKPPSYLFKKVENDLNENDTDLEADSFDQTEDSDKVFVASAYSSNGQKLYPVAGYSWQWDWNVTNDDVAEIVTSGLFGVNGDSQLVRAKVDIVDEKTDLTAVIDITDGTASNVGDGFSAHSDIYVFVCANPWPAIADDFTWSPWLDDDSNCLLSTGTCHDTGQKFYYCRDSGEEGFGDDLPAVSDDTTRGFGDGILKESYFFEQ